MRILRVCLTYPRDIMPGVGLPCYYHSNYSNEENLIITLKTNGKKIESRNNIRIEEIDVKNPSLENLNSTKMKKIRSLTIKFIYQIIFVFKSSKIINEYKPNIVHIYSPIPILFGIYCKIFFHSKIIMSLHGTDVERIALSRLLQKILLIPDKIVCVSDSMITKLKHVKAGIEYIGNGFEQDIFFPLNLQRSKQFINVSSFRWQKGHKFLLQAFSYFLKEYPGYKLILIGDGPDKKEILELINSLSLNDNVVLKGIQSRENIAYELNKSEAFILSSVVEGFPKVVIESMATGTPVISTDVGNVSTVIRNSGIICKPGDSKALFDAMKTFVQEEEWENLNKKSIEYSKNYSWDKVALILEKIYKNSLGSTKDVN